MDPLRIKLTLLHSHGQNCTSRRDLFTYPKNCQPQARFTMTFQDIGNGRQRQIGMHPSIWANYPSHFRATSGSTFFRIPRDRSWPSSAFVAIQEGFLGLAKYPKPPPTPPEPHEAQSIPILNPSPNLNPPETPRSSKQPNKVIYETSCKHLQRGWCLARPNRTQKGRQQQTGT